MIEIAPLRDVDPDDAVLVINAAFRDEDRSRSWYEWKHLECPLGVSTGWVARVDGRVVAVRTFVPWLFDIDGYRRSSLRAMDGAVHPDFQRRGLFSRLVRTQMDLTTESGQDPTLIMSTSVPASREAYRKLGWRSFSVSHRLEIASRGHVKLKERPVGDLDLGGGDTERGQPSQTVRTAWTTETLRWRFDPRSGYDYAAFELETADEANGLVARTATLKGVRVLVPCHTWGPSAHRKALLSSVSRHLRTPLVWRVNSAMQGRQIGLVRGSSTISLWSSSDALTNRLDQPSTWQFDFADLEGVM